ncbi:MAG: UDP-N-acetylmuramate dehydrogenase [Breznakia sp.]
MDIKKLLEAHADVEENALLRNHTTFRVGGEARFLCYPKTDISLLRIVEICKEYNLEYRVFGKGSNMLCSDAFFDGIIICLDRYFIDVSFEEDGKCLVGAGVSTIFLANQAMKLSFSGLEFASGIPATVGGAIFMNAGAYKSEFASVVKRVYVAHDGICEWMEKDTLDFSYRTSRFQKHRDWIVVAAEIKLTRADQKEIRDLMDARRIRRKATQPLEKPSAGSMFRNPVHQQAWELIEACNLRGMQIGGAKVSEKHANFIINEDNATAQDVYDLVSYIQEEVKKKFQVQLKTEVEKFNWKMKKN